MRQPSQWIMACIHGTVWLVFSLTFRVFFRVRRTGREKFPRTGGVLVICNHISWFDPPLMRLLVPRLSHYLAMAELFHGWFWTWFFQQSGVIPVDRSQPGSAPMKEVLRRLRNGKVVIVFPEGGIRSGPSSVLGGNPELKAGAALLAMKAGVPIVPAIIENVRVSYEPRNWFFRRHTIQLALGDPFTLPSDCDREEANAIMREKLVSLGEQVKATSSSVDARNAKAEALPPKPAR